MPSGYWSVLTPLVFLWRFDVAHPSQFAVGVRRIAAIGWSQRIDGKRGGYAASGSGHQQAASAQNLTAQRDGGNANAFIADLQERVIGCLKFQTDLRSI